MRIVQVIDYFQPEVGYQETFFAKEYQKKGYESLVVTSDRFFPFPHYEKTYEKLLGPRFVGTGNSNENGIQTIRLPSIEIPKTNLIYLRYLRQTIKKIRPDIVLCHGVHSLTSYLVSRYKRDLGYKLLYDTHASFFNTNLTNTIPKKIYHFLFQSVAVHSIKKKGDAFFAIGDEEKRFLCQDFHMDLSDVSVVHLGVDTRLFSFSRTARKNIRKILHIDNKEIIILYAGKISPNKDLHVLVQAAKQIFGVPITILLVGGGEKNYIRSLFASFPKKVIHVPFVSNWELPKYFSAADFAAWPGDPSQSMIEAMGCGLPLILPKNQETSFLDKSRAVMRFTRNNVSALTTCINKLSYNTKTRELMRKNAKKYSRTYLSWGVLAEKALLLVK